MRNNVIVLSFRISTLKWTRKIVIHIYVIGKNCGFFWVAGEFHSIVAMASNKPYNVSRISMANTPISAAVRNRWEKANFFHGSSINSIAVVALMLWCLFTFKMFQKKKTIRTTPWRRVLSLFLKIEDIVLRGTNQTSWLRRFFSQLFHRRFAINRVFSPKSSKNHMFFTELDERTLLYGQRKDFKIKLKTTFDSSARNMVKIQLKNTCTIMIGRRKNVLNSLTS